MIDTEALRKKVLDLAIQGKLTEQLPSDGNAEELYAKIQEEKARLIKEGKIKKDKPLPAITEKEIPFEIPKNWKWVRLSEAVDVRDGTHESPKYHKDGIPLITSKNLSTGSLCFDNVKFISKSDADKINERSAVDDGDILFAMIGTIGNPVIVKKEIDFCIKNVALFKKYQNTDLLSEYLLLFLMIEQDKFKKIVSGGLQPFISLKQFRVHLMPLPPLAEQKRIAERIDAIFSQIDIIDDLQTRYNNDSAVLKSKILDAAIRGRLVEQRAEEGTAEELYKQIRAEKQKLIKEGKIKKEKPLPEISEGEIPFDIPESWKWVRLGSLYEINPRVEADNDLSAAFVPMEKISSGLSKQFSYDVQCWGVASKNHTKFQNGDVAFAKISPCFENRKSFIAKDLPNGIGGGTTELIILRQKNVLPEYTYYVITSQRFIDAGSKSYKGIVGQQRIKSDIVSSFLVPLPPLAEQRRIVARIEELLPLCDRLAECREKA